MGIYGVEHITSEISTLILEIDICSVAPQLTCGPENSQTNGG